MAVALAFLAVPVWQLWSQAGAIRPGHPEWPVAWITHRVVESVEKDYADMKAHGVGLVTINARNSADAREKLALARRMGMKYAISLPEVTEHSRIVREAGLEPVDALMIGGVYKGKAIDRHVFEFKASPQKIVIEPPVYNRRFAYTLGSGATGARAKGEPIAHYYPDMPDPVRAEIVVPLKEFDGRQHLRIIPAAIKTVSGDTRIEGDTVTPDMPASSETKNRKLYELSFDLTGLDKALLQKVGVAVYWPYRGTEKYWLFGRGTVSAAAESTQRALRRAVQEALRVWSDANDGRFPIDVVIGARFGDECFYVTGHLGDRELSVSYPLWEFSEPSMKAFRARAGDLEHPRTWGFPEIYGPEAYGWWMYNLHEHTAKLAGIVREEAAKTAAGLLIFRNTTRMGVFAPQNDHDGSGAELLTQNLDVAHLDPYPVSGSGYGANIPRDMSYYAGLARRYNRLLVPWMQAHIYSDLQHVTPEQVDRMAAEQWAQGVDAVMWLGYGQTFPKVQPESWKRAAAFHARLAKGLPPKPKPRMAVIRSYNAWALSSRTDGAIRNPADWMLQQLLEVWAVKHGQPYDVFELAPRLSAEQQKTLDRDLAKYSYVISTAPRKGAWVIGQRTAGQSADVENAPKLQAEFEAELVKRGWLRR